MNIENRVEKVSSFHPVQKFFLLFLLSLFLFSALLWVLDGFDVKQFLAGRQWFVVKSVDVDVAWPLEKKEVMQWLPSLEGQSLLSLNVDKIVESLESKNWVASVTVRKRYPDQVSIRLESKIPKAVFLERSKPFYVDHDGKVIDHTSARISAKYELPVISMLPQATLVKWELPEAVLLTEMLKEHMGTGFTLSEVVLEAYPYFRVFMSNPRVEVLFSHKNWESQISRLLTLLSNPPSQVRQIARINLVFPKKAIVSSTLSN